MKIKAEDLVVGELYEIVSGRRTWRLNGKTPAEEIPQSDRYGIYLGQRPFDEIVDGKSGYVFIRMPNENARFLFKDKVGYASGLDTFKTMEANDVNS